MAARTYNALLLCTGNSARSIFAEAILNRLGEGRVRAYSVGNHPQGKVHPMALEEKIGTTAAPVGDDE